MIALTKLTYPFSEGNPDFSGYLAAGVPIIYTDIPPLREILENKISIPIDNSSDEFIKALKNLRTYINDQKINESYELALESTYKKRATSIYSFCNNEF